MKKYKIELTLMPTSGKYTGSRYISIEMSADDEDQAGKFAVETMSVIVTPDVKVLVRNIIEIQN